MFETIYSQIGAAVTVLVVGFAFLKGDEPERVGGAAFVLVALANALTADSSGGLSQWGWLALDIVLFAVLIGLALYSRRAWPVWAAGFQALIVTGHVLMIANLRPPTDAFPAVINLSNYGLHAALAVGTFWAWQERRVAGKL